MKTGKSKRPEKGTNKIKKEHKNLLLPTIFFLGLFMPMILSAVEKNFSVKVDVVLRGYTDHTPKPTLSTESFSSGEFQKDFSSYFEENLRPRGIATKLYNSVRYYCFSTGQYGRPIGKNKSIFEVEYINSELGLGSYNYALPENIEAMNNYLQDLEEINRKLDKIGKKLYVYVAPGKAAICKSDIPSKYVAMQEENAVNATDKFRDGLSPDIKCFFAEDIADELEYPPYYPTGIHWSRPFEQKVNERIIEDLNELTGKHLRTEVLGEVIESKKPFWWDNDMYGLANVFGSPNITYYEYLSEREFPEQYDNSGILMMGDSFGQGFRKFYTEFYPDNEFYYINYANYIADTTGSQKLINGNYDNIDLKKYLDRVDIVIFEMCEPHLAKYSSGFADYLNDYLDSYQPAKPANNYPAVFNPRANAYCKGVGLYNPDPTFCWTDSYCSFNIKDEEIAEKGMEVIYEVPSYSIPENGTQNVWLYVNGKRMMEASHSEQENNDVFLSPEELPEAEDGVYNILLYTDSYFVPKELDITSDERELALQLKYAGRTR